MIYRAVLWIVLVTWLIAPMFAGTFDAKKAIEITGDINSYARYILAMVGWFYVATMIYIYGIEKNNTDKERVAQHFGALMLCCMFAIIAAIICFER